MKMAKMMKKMIDEIVLWSDRKFYSVNFSPASNELIYRIKIPLKGLEKGYIRSKAKQLEGLS